MGMSQNQSCYIWGDEHPFTSYLGFTRVPRFWLIPIFGNGGVKKIDRGWDYNVMRGYKLSEIMMEKSSGWKQFWSPLFWSEVLHNPGRNKNHCHTTWTCIPDSKWVNHNMVSYRDGFVPFLTWLHLVTAIITAIIHVSQLRCTSSIFCTEAPHVCRRSWKWSSSASQKIGDTPFLAITLW